MNFIKMSKWFTNLTLSLLIALPGFAFEESDIQMQADKVDFDYQKGISYFEGNARFEYKGSKVVSDKAQIATADRIVKAEGNVVIVDDSGAYIADSLDYNFTEKQGELINGLTMDGPWILKGDKITQISKEEIRLDHGSFYLCPHYQIKAKEITVFPGKKIVARNVIFFIGAIPIFYLPYFSRSLDKQWGYRLNIAHNDKFGLQILTQFHTSFENGIDATLHADYYQKRGIGVGVDAKKTYDRGHFKSYSYFINDDEFEPNRSSEEAGELTRYALSLEHYHKFENDWNSSLDLNIHSDEDFYDDFFTDRFDEDIQKDNRYRLSSSNERYSLGLNVRVRLNDFYNVLERMPQLHFDWHSMEIGENTNIFYSSSNQAVNLQQKFDDEDEDKDEIDLFRFNSSHRLEYSKKFWGWLSVSPNVVMEGTWYSKTKRIETEDVSTVIGMDPLTGEDILSTSTVERNVEEDADFRTQPRFGVSFTTNMFKLMETRTPRFGYSRFRHALTPKLSYSFRPDPSLENDEVFQLDEIDNRKDRNKLKLQLISRWQAKENEYDSSVTLFNTRYSVEYDIDEDDDPWGLFEWESQVRMREDLFLDYRVRYEVNESELKDFRTDMAWQVSEFMGLSLGYLHRKNDDDIITPELSLLLGTDLFLRGYAYYNEGQSAVERFEIALVKGFHCMDFAFIYRERDFREEQTFYFSITPKNLNTGKLRFSN